MLASPFHPGQFLRKLVEEHEVTQTRLAKHLGVQIGVINQICNEKRGISPAMAMKLSMAFRTSPELWLNLQTAYELGRVSKRARIIRPLTKSAL
jgi:addiction module HigA family antidote